MMDLLYLEGDRCSLKYLLGAFQAAGINAEHPDVLPKVWSDYDVVVLSDYSADKLGIEHARQLADEISRGLGLLMVGGWTSFGRGGYARSPLSDVLPVILFDGDDRRALVRGAHPIKRRDHEALAALDWAHAPVLCGLNRLAPKPAANVVLALDDGSPLLIAGEHGAGRVLAYASDLAPHWSGGLTDWGDSTVPGPDGEEMGTDYVAFIASMIRWIARAKPKRIERA